jgi:N-acyl-D-amino-acid deacylase
MTSRFRLVIGFAAFVALSAPISTQTPARYDVLIRSGRVLDGSGNPWIAADIGIRGSPCLPGSSTSTRMRRRGSKAR